MIPISSCSCLCPIRWSQVLSREWRCSWSNTDMRCSVFALSAGPRPEATKNWAGPASFPFGPASFSSFSFFKIFKDEFRAGKFWNLNAKTGCSNYVWVINNIIACTLEFQITAHACLFILIFLTVYSHSIWVYSLNQICVWCQPTPLLGPVCLTSRD